MYFCFKDIRYTTSVCSFINMTIVDELWSLTIVQKSILVSGSGSCVVRYPTNFVYDWNRIILKIKRINTTWKLLNYHIRWDSFSQLLTLKFWYKYRESMHINSIPNQRRCCTIKNYLSWNYNVMKMLLNQCINSQNYIKNPHKGEGNVVS